MNKKLENLKKEYESIHPSEEFRQKINTILEQSQAIQQQNNKVFQKQKRYFGILAAGFAVLAVGFIGTLNVSPAFAATVSELPGMNHIVNVLTFHKYEFSQDNMQAEVVTPEITGLSNKELEEALNKEFQQYSNKIIEKFEKDVQSLQSAFPDSDPHMGVFSSYEVKTNTEDYLALDIFVTNIAGSSSDIHKYYTIDKHTNSLVTLSDLFQPDADYVTPISQYIAEQMRRQNASGENFYWIDYEDVPEWNFKSINENQNFYINETGNIVICFDEYEVGPGSSGSPCFEIPQQVVADILKTNIPATQSNASDTKTISQNATELSEDELKQKLTEDFHQYGQKIIENFEKDIAALLPADSQSAPHMGIISNYTVKTNTADYLSIQLYTASTVGTFSMQKYYTIDKHTNTLVVLSDLFQSGADYLTPINQYITEQMRRQNASGENVYWIDYQEVPEWNFKSINENQNFYINETGNIVICFDKYEVGPGSSGSPCFEIPQQVVANILK